MELGLVFFLTVAFATHALVGVALVRGFSDVGPRVGPWLGAVFGFVPDADFLFPAAWGWPFVHRGITHSPLFVLSVVGGVYALSRRRSFALAAGLATGSHLVIDSLSPMAIPWVFPLRATWTPGLDVHGVIATPLLWSVSLAIVARRTDDLDAVKQWWSRDGSVRGRQSE
ncbi:metal-dependent hydrolase [Natrinema sp. LN54]|uniref:metal-dependent hydrolase n=1 Tax=Natrinema sp. LN54 TaxID=3458705 RepID=UPI004036A733